MKPSKYFIAGALAVLAMPALAESGDPRGFYIGIGGGVNYTEDTTVEGHNLATFFRFKNVDTKLGWTANGFVGYQFGNAKFEIEGVFRRNKIHDAAYTLTTTGDNIKSAAVMANFIWEFFARATVTPYIGAGAGAVRVWMKQDDDYTFAYQGIAGINIKLTDNVILGVDYRYFRTVDPHLHFRTGSYSFDYVNHTAMVTLTYRFSSPAPAPVAAAPAPAPAPQIARNYMVFFDFDRADINAQADAIIKQAAGAAKQGGVQRLNVTGHTDRAGSEQYNMALSLRRANAVKNALVREGISPDQIAVVGRGETQNLVPTQDGVREPQNRRVEIVLQ